METKMTDAFIRLCGALGISTENYDLDMAALLAATRIERLEAKIPKLNVDLAQASMHAYDGEVARMNLTAERDEWKQDAERLAKSFVIEAYPHEWVCRSGCHHMGKSPDTIEHAPNCPITLHRELVEKYKESK